MAEPMRPVAVPPRPEFNERLDSWKEIAAYLDREVRTVQGWEKNEGLPVHRHQHGRYGSVYAFRTELDAWREARKPAPEVKTPAVEARRRDFPWGLVVVGVAVVLLVVAVVFVYRGRHVGATEAVVVLPFLDLSPEHDQEYFSDGLTEEIIDALSRVPNLRVVARTSAFAFKGKATDIRRIGEQLNAGTVLEGSVRKSGDQLRITAQLNRVSDGTHLWSRTYDRKLRDIFALQHEISQAIADQLRAGRVPKRDETKDVAAYGLYQEARYLFNQYTPDSLTKAIERYQAAIDRDPKFVQAYAGMADAYAYLCENFYRHPREVMPKAKAAAEKAVAMDSNSAEAHISRGIVMMDYDWDRDGAQAEFRKALELNPGSSWARHWYAHSLEAQGRMPEATKEMRAALALDPLSVPIYWDIGEELNWAGRYDESIAHLKRGSELFPNQPIILFMEAWAYFAKGDVAAGQRTMDAVKASAAAAGLQDDPTLLTFQGWAAAEEGRMDEARRILDRLEVRREKEYVEPMLVTWLCSALHDRAAVIKWLERGYEERSSLFLYGPINKGIYGGNAEAAEIFRKGIR